MDTALARLKEHSVDYFLAGFPDGIGGQAFFSDPNGVKVEITYRPKA